MCFQQRMEGDMTDATTAHKMARIFAERYGDRAALEVNRRERKARESGMDHEAEDWHRVRQTLEIMKGPPVT